MVKPRKRSASIDRDFYKDNQEWLEFKNAKIKQQQAVKLRRELTNPDLTFKPKINSRSKDLLKYHSFNERQFQFEKKKNEKQTQLIKQLPKYTFKPNLNKKSLKMAEKQRDTDLRRTASAVNNIRKKEGKNSVDVKFVALKTVKVNKKHLPINTTETLKENRYDSPEPRVQPFEAESESYVTYKLKNP